MAACGANAEANEEVAKEAPKIDYSKMTTGELWKCLQSKAKTEKDKKLRFVVFSLNGKDGKLEEFLTKKEVDEQKMSDEEVHAKLEKGLLESKAPRFAGLDLHGKVFFISYISDNSHKANDRFQYAQHREEFKMKFQGIAFNIAGNNPGDIAYSVMKEKVDKKAVS